MTCGIYKIENTKNNKCYIGCSKNIENRWKEHLYSLKKDSHHSIKLQNSWNKYGEKHFKFEIIEECDNDILFDREKYYIDKYNSAILGCNMIDGTGVKPKYDIKKIKRQTYYDSNKIEIDKLIELTKELHLYNYKFEEVKFNFIYSICKEFKDCKTLVRHIKFFKILLDFIKSVDTNKGKLYITNLKFDYVNVKLKGNILEENEIKNKEKYSATINDIIKLFIDEVKYSNNHKEVLSYICNIEYYTK